MKDHANRILIAGLAAGVWFLSCSVSFASAASPVASLQLPQASVDLSDLDVRDHLNRPVHSAAQKQQLRNLFEQGLYKLFTNNLTPSKQILLTVLMQSWNGAFGWLKTTSWQWAVQLQMWWKEIKTKKPFLSLQNFPAHLNNRTGFTLESSRVNFHSLTALLLFSTTLRR